MTDTELQQQAAVKYRSISQGQSSDNRTVRLYNIQNLLNKLCLSEQDRQQLYHFITATRSEVDITAYWGNSVITVQSTDHKITVLRPKNTKTAK